MSAFFAWLTLWKDRLVIVGVAIMAGLLVALWLYAQHEREAAARFRQQAQVARSQAVVNDAATKAVDQVAQKTVIIHDRTDHAVQSVQKAPGADSPVPADVLAAWRDGVRQLRDGSSDPPAE